MPGVMRTIQDIVRRSWQRFRGSRVTVSLISVLLVLYSLGLIIPQKVMFSTREQYEGWKAASPLLSAAVEALHLNEIYVAPITIVFLTLFFLNLVVVLSYRVPTVLKRAYLVRDRSEHDARSIADDPRTSTIDIGAGDIADVQRHVAGFLRSRLWFSPRTTAPGTVLAVKNRYSPLGFLLFHASFLLCLIGGLLIVYTRFSGNIVLTEGQSFAGDMTQFWQITRDAKIFKQLPAVEIMVDKVLPSYAQDVATDLAVKLSIVYNDDVREETVKVNEPVRRGSLSILSQRIGVSPFLVLKDARGKVVDAGYVSLNILHGEEDSFAFEGFPDQFQVRFYPDHEVVEGEDRTRSLELRNPVLKVRVAADAPAAGDQTIPLGRTASFGTHTLAFEDIRYWVDFLFVREFGELPLFIGFAVGAAGLIMRLIFYQKTLRVYLERRGEGIRLYILGQSEYYPHSFAEELDLLVKDLRSAISGKGDNDRG